MVGASQPASQHTAHAPQRTADRSHTAYAPRPRTLHLAPQPASVCAQPFKLTAQQYQECWRERVERENKTIVLGFGKDGEEPPKTAGSTAGSTSRSAAAAAPVAAAPAPELAAAEKDDDAVSVVSKASSHRSRRSVAASGISSNVSTNSATERKLKLLEAQLEKEQVKRKELEELLKAQRAANSS